MRMGRRGGVERLCPGVDAHECSGTIFRRDRRLYVEEISFPEIGKV